MIYTLIEVHLVESLSKEEEFSMELDYTKSWHYVVFILDITINQLWMF